MYHWIVPCFNISLPHWIFYYEYCEIFKQNNSYNNKNILTKDEYKIYINDVFNKKFLVLWFRKPPSLNWSKLCYIIHYLRTFIDENEK